MTPRERVIAVIRREEPDRIPFYDSFFSIEAEEKFIPRYAGLVAYGTRPARRLDPALTLEMLSSLDLDIAEAGSARLRTKFVREDEREQLVEYENGAVWRYVRHPASELPFRLPLSEGGDPWHVPMPDPRDPGRYREIRDAQSVLRRAGYFTLVKLHGFFAGAHYLFRPFEQLLMDMAADASYADAIIGRIGTYTLACAEEVLRCGVDCVLIGDDMGWSTGLRFSPRMYRRFIQPWHARLAEPCHAKGAYLHVHSHGHIVPIMDDLVDAGIDLMDPLGPTGRHRPA